MKICPLVKVWSQAQKYLVLEIWRKEYVFSQIDLLDKDDRSDSLIK
jgi:hypothetical protein